MTKMIERIEIIGQERKFQQVQQVHEDLTELMVKMVLLEWMVFLEWMVLLECKDHKAFQDLTI
jgi:hypothetical protein